MLLALSSKHLYTHGGYGRTKEKNMQITERYKPYIVLSFLQCNAEQTKERKFMDARMTCLVRKRTLWRVNDR
jgi:hypothetical protein